MRISDWSSDVCSSDLVRHVGPDGRERSTWDGAWYNCGRKTFPWFATTQARALEAAKAWILFVYNEPGPWKRNVLGDYVPARVADRKSVVSGKSVSVRVYLGGRRNIKRKTIQKT